MVRTKDEITVLYYRHADTVYRVCYTFMKRNRMDLEDAFQAAFLALMRSGKCFDSTEHEKAWLIVTASNICRNMLKKKHREDVEFVAETHADSIHEDETLKAVLQMPEYERVSVYLHYYEGYTAKEIGAMLHKKESTVWGYLFKGRKILKKMLVEDIQ